MSGVRISPGAPLSSPHGLNVGVVALNAANYIELFEELPVPIFDRLIVSYFLVCLITPIGHIHAGDAAIEIQEGNVHNWIKYYEKELGIEIADPVPQGSEAERVDVEHDHQETGTEATQNSPH